MKRLFALVGAAVLTAALISPVLGGSRTFSFSAVTGKTYAVSQQPGVINPTDCAWALLDTRLASGSGFLRKSSGDSGRFCVIEDNVPHLVIVGVFAFSSDLSVVVGVGPDTFTLTPAPDTLNPGWYRYSFAARTPTFALSDLPVIPGSNGGRGLVVNMTLSITNDSGHNFTTDTGAELKLAPA